MESDESKCVFELVDCIECYWDFVRKLRIDPRNAHGFVEQVQISEEQQVHYMKKYCNQYKVCLAQKEPVGFIGDISGDIRVCVREDWKGKGVATFMVQEYCRYKKNVFAKVKIDNAASIALFEKSGFEARFIIFQPKN